MSQVSGETLGQLPSVGYRLHGGKNSGLGHSKEKKRLFRKIHTPQSECGPSQKARDPDF